MKATITRATDVERTGRVRQIEGIFDLSPTQRSEQTWDVDLPLEDRDWNVGLIVGPSGSGKTTIMRECFGDPPSFEWDPERSIIDGFPEGMKTQEIVGLLSSVGFSSPPAWMRPFGTLSNGEQFRVTLARTLAEQPELAVVDEFTSVVDRTVAKVASAAVAKAVRRTDRKLVVASCHYDVIEWLQPDWIYDTAGAAFTWRCLRPRPAIDLELRPAPRDAWRIFRHHHYLSSSLSASSVAWVALVDGQPAAFASALKFVHPKVDDMVREHRTVCLPDFQGVGIGNAVSEAIASLFVARGWRYLSVTSNPAMIRHRARSPLWHMERAPSFVPPPGKTKTGTYARGKGGKRSAASHSHLRMTSSFQYVGPPADPDHVEALMPRTGWAATRRHRRAA